MGGLTFEMNVYFGLNTMIIVEKAIIVWYLDIVVCILKDIIEKW